MTPEQYTELLIRTLKKGSIITLTGDTPFQSEKRHHFVVLNYDPASSEYLIAVNNTSKVVDRLTYLHKQNGTKVTETTVVFEPGQYDFFPEQTLFDCNTVHEISAAELAAAHTKGYLTIPDIDVKLQEEDLDKIYRAVLKSRSVSPVNKKMIDPNYGKA